MTPRPFVGWDSLYLGRRLLSFKQRYGETDFTKATASRSAPCSPLLDRCLGPS